LHLRETKYENLGKIEKAKGYVGESGKQAAGEQAPTLCRTITTDGCVGCYPAEKSRCLPARTDQARLRAKQLTLMARRCLRRTWVRDNRMCPDFTYGVHLSRARRWSGCGKKAVYGKNTLTAAVL